MPQTDHRTNVDIDPTRDVALTPFARKLLQEHYLRADETPQLGFARAARAWCGGDLALAQRLYDGVSKGWFMFASPVLSNAPLPGESVKGMPISCFLTSTDDTLEGLMAHTTELRWLSVLGGGVGGHWSDVRSVSKKSPGPIPFLHTINADMEAYSQGVTRRGSYAAYLDVSHPDIMEFLSLRRVGGDEHRKCFSKGFHHAVNITDAFMTAVDAGAPWQLIDPHDQTVRETVSARTLWQEILETRYRTGEPYLFFIDTANRGLPAAQQKLGLRLTGSNLCSEVTLPVNNDRTAVCCLSSLNAETYDEWKDSTIVSDLCEMLDNVLTYFIDTAPAPLSKAVFSASQERAIGLGLMGFHAYIQKHNVPFESDKARKMNRAMFSHIDAESLGASRRLATQRGEAPDMVGTGLRFSHRSCLAPNANSAILLATSPSIEPAAANAFVHEARVGTWPVRNRYLERLLQEKGQSTDAVWRTIITSKGSVQHLDFLTEHEKAVFKTAIEIDQMWVVKHAADRQPYICQAQSVNLFFTSKADKKAVHAVHRAAHRLGLKSLYYLRTESSKKAEDVGKTVVRDALIDAVPAVEETGCAACEG